MKQGHVVSPRHAVLQSGAGLWVDGLLFLAGAASLYAGSPIGIALIALGMVWPVLRLATRKRHSLPGGITRLVPRDLADAHEDVVSAASLEGVLEGRQAIAAADQILLPVAIALAGREPSGRRQRWFVRSRVQALQAIAEELSDRHVAWVEARAEVEALGQTDQADVLASVTGDETSGPLVALLVVLLLPVFLVWDLIRATVTAVRSLRDALAMRLAATWTVIVAVAGAGTRLFAAAWLRCQRVKALITASVVAARHRVAVIRTRVRLRLLAGRRAAGLARDWP